MMMAVKKLQSLFGWMSGAGDLEEASARARVPVITTHHGRHARRRRLLLRS
jgi:hypothetical protein